MMLQSRSMMEVPDFDLLINGEYQYRKLHLQNYSYLRRQKTYTKYICGGCCKFRFTSTKGTITLKVTRSYPCEHPETVHDHKNVIFKSASNKEGAHSS